MIEPLNHSKDAVSVATYKVEPYVMAADVYANESHKGRGGWTWYTGSAGWMYQFIITSLLGMELQKDKLVFKPCFPMEWPSVYIRYKYGRSTYHLTIFQHDVNERDALGAEKASAKNVVQLVDDAHEHTLEVHTMVNQLIK